jgi:hypothetical protein
MRDLFPGHYRPSSDELNHLWKNALFVFDTNVLLNLYSYPEQAREVFFSVLGSISGRIWIPYQVALEFHRNRFNRVKSSNKAVYALRDRLLAASEQLEADFKKIEFEKRNTGINDLDVRISAVKNANDKLVQALTAACDRLPGTSLDDPIGAHIADLFNGKVGPSPSSQAALDELTKDGDNRIKRRIPPGFKDGNKGDEYIDRGLVYQAKFGDLILWKQAIAHVKEIGKGEVIFVTGDRKEDWWDEDEGKIRGPLPELVYEFLAESNAKSFWIYTVDMFLQFAKEYLESKDITPEAIAQVKETADHASTYELYVSELSKALEVKPASSRWKNVFSYNFDRQINTVLQKHSEHRAVGRWLRLTYPLAEISVSKEPSFLVAQNGEVWGFDTLSAAQLDPAVALQRINAGQDGLRSGLLQKYSIVIIIDPDEPDDVVTELTDMSKNIRDALHKYDITSLIFGQIQGEVFQVIRIIKN